MQNLPKEIKNLKYLAEGKRSIVYTGVYNKKQVCIKTKNEKSEAKDRLNNEAKFLKILNKYNIGPKLIHSGKDYIIYIYVSGILLPEFLKKTKTPFPIIKEILIQCRTLDKLNINKLEFTRPFKHIFIKNKKVTMIDFERCYKTDKPKNITQFCQYLTKEEKFKINNKVFREILKEYKQKQTDKNFKRILEYLKENIISSS